LTGEAVARPQLGLLTRNAGLLVRSGFVPDAVLAFALSMAIFYPKSTSHLHSSMTPLVLVVLLIWINGVLERQDRDRSARWIIALMVTYSMGMVILAKLIARVASSSAATTLEHIVLLLPLSAAAGWILVATGRIVQYLSWLLVVGTITVLPAMYEYLANASLINPTLHARNGQTRAIVGSDHPLVLGALFLALIPIAMYLAGRYRYLAGIWLYLGILTTGSNGPKLVGAVVLAVCFVPQLARALLSRSGPLYAVCAGIAVYIFVGSNWFWTTQIKGTNTNDVSDQYRAALYAVLPHLLGDRPLGYGLGGLPPDTFYAYTATSGVFDIGSSIDSELVYGATQFGYIAILVFLGVAAFGVRAIRRNHAIGLSSLSTTLVGLFLAIHSWNSLGAFWFLGFGSCAALVLGRDDWCEWTGLVPQPDQMGASQHVVASVT